MKYENFDKAYEFYPHTVAGVFDALYNTRQTHADLEAAKIATQQVFDDFKSAQVIVAHRRVTELKEHTAAGFRIIDLGKGENACFLSIGFNRDLYYYPYDDFYRIVRADFDDDLSDGEIISFKMGNPKSAIYFAKQVL